MSAAPMSVDDREAKEAEEFRTGPLSVLTTSVKTNSQVNFDGFSAFGTFCEQHKGGRAVHGTGQACAATAAAAETPRAVQQLCLDLCSMTFGLDTGVCFQDSSAITAAQQLVA